MMNIIPNECWGIIPARGGSKNLPLKNIAPFNGRPIIDYCALAARACPRLSRVLCSTDSDKIAERCGEIGVEVMHRPEELAGDEVDMYEVIAGLLIELHEKSGAVPEMMALLMPTSPFILAKHISDCVDLLLNDKEAGSSQTVIRCPHVQHAYNQRVIEDNIVRFKFIEERRKCYNKQTKPMHYLFGNLIVFRALPALEQEFLFAEPSYPVEIPHIYGFDADGPDEFHLGPSIVSGGLVSLPHMA